MQVALDSSTSAYGRYELESEIGRDGMGVVYRAIDRLTGEVVALKRITTFQNRSEILSDTPQKDFQIALAHELQTLASLRHPHIASVLDYGFDAERRPFFTTTDTAESQTILEASYHIAFEEKIELVQQLLQALAYLHRRGVLHRGLKPENVLVRDGAVYLTGFRLSVDTQLNDEGYADRLAYMAPELFLGSNHTRATDLYAVAILLCELLAGRHPFAPFNNSFISRVCHAKPNIDQIDADIQPLMRQLLEKKPADRFQSAHMASETLARAFNQMHPTENQNAQESDLQAAQFVGRMAELSQLKTALANATSDQGAVWLIGGESGGGKTRLAEELRTHALV